MDGPTDADGPPADIKNVRTDRTGQGRFALPRPRDGRRDVQRKKGSWTPSASAPPPVVSAFDHINVVGLHNLKPTKGHADRPSGREGAAREGGGVALHWRRVRRQEKERGRERERAKGTNAAFEATMEDPTG